jgi:hypothetical protein
LLETDTPIFHGPLEFFFYLFHIIKSPFPTFITNIKLKCHHLLGLIPPLILVRWCEKCLWCAYLQQCCLVTTFHHRSNF